MGRRRTLAAVSHHRIVSLLVVVSALASSGVYAAPPPLTAREWELYVYWRDGRDEPQLAKDPDGVRLKKIARANGVAESELKKAVERVTPLAATLKADTETSVRTELDTTPIKKQIQSIDVNVETGHAVAFVKWSCGDSRDTDKEAAYVAWAVAVGAPAVKTLALWCVNGADTKLFSAKIGRDALGRIDVKSIERFAASRYIRLFEEVKRGPHT